MDRLTWSRAAIVFVAYVGLAILQAWPLPLHLDTHLTGPPSGDTGVYVWNTWVFRDELLEHRRWPLQTGNIFVGDEPANLAHHNYTLFANLVAVPLQSVTGVISSFNLVYLINIALAGFGMFLLARRVATRETEAWLAGALFACSGFLVGRSVGHFSLVAAAPLPFFVYFLIRCWERRRTRDALALGLTAAWALSADPYYAVYCLMIAGGFLLSRGLAFSLEVSSARGWKRAVTICAMLAGGLIAGRLITGGAVWRAGLLEVSVRSLYTPVFILTVAIVLRALMAIRVHWSRDPWPPWTTLARLSVVTVAAAGFAAAPVLWAYTFSDAMDAPPIFWRTGPQGADLLALLLPRADHPWMPSALVAKLASHPGGIIEQSASLSLGALLVIGLAWWRASWRPSLRWSLAAVTFALMTMGPFVHVAGVNTYIPTPWTILRYVPILSDARMPSRMAVVATMAVAMLFAGALGALTTRNPKYRAAILIAVAALVCVDLWPSSRVLYPAGIPAIYERIARDSRPVSLLTLPTGVRDGLGSLGNFSAHEQFYQTLHGKPIVGGYLSRTTPRRREAHATHPVLGPLVALSDGESIDAAQWASARAGAADFAKEVNLGYVVIDHRAASPELTRFAVEVLKLFRVERDADRSIYVPFGKFRVSPPTRP